MNKEMSLAMLKLEREGAKDAPPKLQEMLEVVEKAIEADTITYEDFVEQLTTYFEELVPDDEGSTIESRSEAVDKMCDKIIDKYAGKEE